jgi:hypothetical protein
MKFLGIAMDLAACKQVHGELGGNAHGNADETVDKNLPCAVLLRFLETTR